MKVVYLSQFRDSSGYASAARGYLKAFDNYLTAHPGEFELKVHTLVVEHSSCLNTEERKLLEKYEFSSDSEIEQFVKGKYLLIWHQPPPMLPNFINMYGETDQYWAAARKLIENATKNINLTVWEADKAPEFWNKVYDMYETDALIAPSRWNQEVFTNDYKRQCYLVPHVLDEKIVKPKPMNLPTTLDDKFVVFAMSQWNNRKGFDKLIHAFSMEFGRNRDVVLVIKTYDNLMKSYPISMEDQARNIANEVGTIKNSVFMPDGQQPNSNIILIPSVLPYENISWLYEKSHLFALMTRGEGFGLTIAEALLHKKPVLVPDQGGHLDFIHPEAAFLCEGHWAPYINRPEYHCDMNWYEPHINSARKQFRKAYNLWGNDAAALTQMGEVGYQHITDSNSNYSEQYVGKLLADIVKKEFGHVESVEVTSTPQEAENKRIKENIKWKLNRATNIEEKVEILKDKYKGKTAYILTCGPSLSDQPPEHLREKLKDELVIAVKQAYSYVPDIVDLHMWNCSNLPQPKPNNSTVHYDYDEDGTDPIVIASSNYPLGTRWHKSQKTDLFFQIPIRTEINNEFIVFTKEFEKYALDNSLERPCGPGIMFETVIHTAVHLGVSRIVVLGWDFAKANPKVQSDHKHFYGETDELFNRGDILSWEILENVKASKECFEWLQDRNIELELASNQSALYEKIPRIKL